MPQTFQVLRCYKCEAFQVHPTKKSNKWKCKLCDEKQSIKRFYGLGTGKECRLQVQKLNGIRGKIHDDDEEHTDVSSVSDHTEQDEIPPCSIAKKSKWLEYVDQETEENQMIEESQTISDKTMHCHNKEVVLELPRKHSKKLIAISSKIKNKTETEPVSNFSSLNNEAKTNLMKSIENNKSNLTNIGLSSIKSVQAQKAIKNSKWTKFVEADQNCQQAEANPIKHTSGQSMFLFLEDEDIDLFLDL